MRLGLVLGAAALLLSIASAAQPASQPKQWACEGAAKGKNGSEVSMVWFVEANGSVVSRYADWSPPSLVTTGLAAQPPGAVFDSAPDLSISYLQPEKAGIGPPDMVFTSITSEAGPGLIDDPTVTLKLDGGREWTVALPPVPEAFFLAEPPPSGLPFVILSGHLAETDTNPDLLLALETARAADATLNDKSGRPLGRVYDLSARVERDRLYQKAWAAAELAARRPKCCQETAEAPPLQIPVT